jgi:predicted nucleotidyltransferase
MEKYRTAARQRRQARATRLGLRRERELQIATEASGILKRQFGAGRVVLFGSLLLPDGFHQRSDIDLVVWGLAEKDHFRAVARLLSLDREFSIDKEAVRGGTI